MYPIKDLDRGKGERMGRCVSSNRRLKKGPDPFLDPFLDVEVWAYGSRVNGRSHDGSDLDLVLLGPGLKEIPTEQLGEFEEAVRESTIPFLVEARDWARLPDRFHREIERNYVVLVSSSPEQGDANWQEKC